MPYKRPVHNSKKYTSPFYSPKPSYSMNASGLPPHKDFFGIPLPNEKEAFHGHIAGKKKVPGLAGILEFVREHIKIEELILIGLIILILDESIEDDLLLIALIYILLF
jgi:hypothetical protein